jgi:hypothetical protein
VGLHLYGYHRHREGEPLFQAIHTLSINGPEEAEVVAPLVQAGLEVPPAQDRLPLQEIHPFEEPGLSGVWLTLTGTWRQGGQPVLYGQVVHVDPRLLTLRSLLNWSSPPRQRPTWRDLDQQGAPELVINQSVGLEPNLRGYALAGGGDSILAQRLVAIDLLETALEGPEQSAYETAIYLAQNGLWSLAHQRLDQVKARMGPRWPLAAERQRQLIGFHATITATQAEANWSQPNQKVLALLIDGRWTTALEQIKTPSDSLRTGLMPLLGQDPSGRLWRRVNAALRVDRRQDSARLWGALLLWAKQDQTAADRWLGQTPEGQRLRNQLGAIATALTPPTVPVSDPAIAPRPTSPPETSVPQVWVGRVAELSALNLNEWQSLAPAPSFDQALTLPQGHRWYRIQVQHQGGREGWAAVAGEVTPPAATALAEQSWQLVSVDGGVPISVTVQGVQRGDRWVLLAHGPSSAGVDIAVAGGSFQGLAQVGSEGGDGLGAEPLQRAIAELWPDLADVMATATDPNGGGTMPITLRRLDLTGDGEAEGVLTRTDQRTAIVSATGEVLYATAAGQPLLGWVYGGDRPLLVVADNPYRWVSWSPASGRFNAFRVNPN